LKTVAVVNFYSSQANKPGGMRTQFWESFLSDQGCRVDVVNFDLVARKRLIRIALRILNLIFSNRPSVDSRYLEKVREWFGLREYDFVILCVPSYEVLELDFTVFGSAKVIVDIRDGILFESLFSTLEVIRYKSWLAKLERKLESADLLVTNVPGLKEHYEKLTGRFIPLLLNQVEFYPVQHKFDLSCEGQKNPVILHFGSLLSSSRGQNVIPLVRALKRFNKEQNRNISLVMVGQYHWFERLFYRLFGGDIQWHRTVPRSDISKFIFSKTICLVVCTSARDVLPAKTFTYLQFPLKIATLGYSRSLNFLGIYKLSNVYDLSLDEEALYEQLNDLVDTPFEAPPYVQIHDEREIFQKFLVCDRV
jgi:hypothetical protein